MSSKYKTLANYLQSQTETQITVPFATIEDILGFPLPKSARKYRPWWANDMTHTHAKNGWLGVGWEVEGIDMLKEIVQFRQTGSPKAAPESVYSSVSASTITKSISGARQFEEVARKVLSEHFGIDLRPRQVSEVPKLFDFVSVDYQVVGDAKYYSMVRGQSIPPAKFSTIAEHVWLLEKIKAERKFLVFGNDRRVPEGWLQRYGALVVDVEFYFIDENQQLTQLR